VSDKAKPRVPGGELEVVQDVPARFAEVVAHAFTCAFADRAHQRREPFRLVLSGGATARRCYEALAGRGDIDWGRVECLVGDERCVPPEHPDSNQAMIRETLIDRVQPNPRLIPLRCEAPQEYEALIEACGRLDLIHLGMGPDGHTASLFPGSKALSASGQALVLRTEDPGGLNAHPRVTLTLRAIARARLVVFTVAGADKHDAMARVIAGEDLPATRVKAERVLWLCDTQAVSPLVSRLGLNP